MQSRPVFLINEKLKFLMVSISVLCAPIPIMGMEYSCTSEDKKPYTLSFLSKECDSHITDTSTPENSKSAWGTPILPPQAPGKIFEWRETVTEGSYISYDSSITKTADETPPPFITIWTQKADYTQKLFKNMPNVYKFVKNKSTQNNVGKVLFSDKLLESGEKTSDRSAFHTRLKNVGYTNPQIVAYQAESFSKEDLTQIFNCFKALGGFWNPNAITLILEGKLPNEIEDIQAPPHIFLINGSIKAVSEVFGLLGLSRYRPLYKYGYSGVSFAMIQEMLTQKGVSSFLSDKLHPSRDFLTPKQANILHAAVISSNGEDAELNAGTNHGVHKGTMFGVYNSHQKLVAYAEVKAADAYFCTVQLVEKKEDIKDSLANHQFVLCKQKAPQNYKDLIKFAKDFSLDAFKNAAQKGQNSTDKGLFKEIILFPDNEENEGILKNADNNQASAYEVLSQADKARFITFGHDKPINDVPAGTVGCFVFEKTNKLFNAAFVSKNEFVVNKLPIDMVLEDKAHHIYVTKIMMEKSFESYHKGLYILINRIDSEIDNAFKDITSDNQYNWEFSYLGCWNPLTLRSRHRSTDNSTNKYNSVAWGVEINAPL